MASWPCTKQLQHLWIYPWEETLAFTSIRDSCRTEGMTSHCQEAAICHHHIELEHTCTCTGVIANAASSNVVIRSPAAQDKMIAYSVPHKQVHSCNLLCIAATRTASLLTDMECQAWQQPTHWDDDATSTTALCKGCLSMPCNCHSQGFFAARNQPGSAHAKQYASPAVRVAYHLPAQGCICTRLQYCVLRSRRNGLDCRQAPQPSH